MYSISDSKLLFLKNQRNINQDGQSQAGHDSPSIFTLQIAQHQNTSLSFRSPRFTLTPLPGKLTFFHRFAEQTFIVLSK